VTDGVLGTFIKRWIADNTKLAIDTLRKKPKEKGSLRYNNNLRDIRTLLELIAIASGIRDDKTITAEVRSKAKAKQKIEERPTHISVADPLVAKIAKELDLEEILDIVRADHDTMTSLQKPEFTAAQINMDAGTTIDIDDAKDNTKILKDMSAVDFVTIVRKANRVLSTDETQPGQHNSPIRKIFNTQYPGKKLFTTAQVLPPTVDDEGRSYGTTFRILFIPVPSDPTQDLTELIAGSDRHFGSFIWDASESNDVPEDLIDMNNQFVFNPVKCGLWLSALNDSLPTNEQADKNANKTLHRPALRMQRRGDSRAPKILVNDETTGPNALRNLTTFMNHLISNPNGSSYGKDLGKYINVDHLSKYTLSFEIQTATADNEPTKEPTQFIIPVLTKKQ